MDLKARIRKNLIILGEKLDEYFEAKAEAEMKLDKKEMEEDEISEDII